MRRLFYEQGKCKLDYIRKEKFRASAERNVSNLKTLKNVIWQDIYISSKQIISLRWPKKFC